MTVAPLKQPDWQTGFNVFGSRAFSLIAAFILAVIMCIASFMLLTFPVITGYYYAVRHSRREEFFIDLPNIVRTVFLVLEGIGRFFFQSYVVGLLGLLPAIILFLTPVLPWSILESEAWMYASIPLMILWLPAFFLMGVTVFNAYPYLIATNDGIGAMRQAFSAGRDKPLIALARGSMLLLPLPGWLIHFLMVFSYPIITAWAVAETEDAPHVQRVAGLWEGVASGLVLAAAMLGACYLFVGLWETAGFIVWLVFCFIAVMLWARRYSSRRSPF